MGHISELRLHGYDDELSNIMHGNVPGNREAGPTKDIAGALGTIGWLGLVVGLKYKTGM